MISASSLDDTRLTYKLFSKSSKGFCLFISSEVSILKLGIFTILVSSFRPEDKGASDISSELFM